MNKNKFNVKNISDLNPDIKIKITVNLPDKRLETPNYWGQI